MEEADAGNRRVRLVAWFLAISYGIGAPLTAVIEFRDATISQRFDLPPELVYVTCVVQVAAAIGVLIRPLAPWAAAAFTAITLGAIGSHLRIGSPQTAVAAVLYTVLQVWFGLKMRRPQAAETMPSR